MNLWSLAAHITRFWDRFQVELHGRFSSHKVEEMREYAMHTSRLRLLFVGVLTPVPALIAITLVDCIPLVSPDKGTDRNYAFWIRMIIAMTIFLAGLFNHFRCCLPGLPMTNWQMLRSAFLSTIAGLSFAYAISRAIGFPVPFTIPVGAVVALLAIVVAVVHLWGPFLRGNLALQHALRQQILVVCGQFIMTWTYPLYLFAFTSVGSAQQSMFTFVLPIIKLAFKNYYSRTLHQLDDLKPAFIVFNIDLFNALYVANCLQSSQSLVNTLLVMVVDIAQMIVSMNDASLIMREIRSLVRLDAFDGSLLDLYVELGVASDTDTPTASSKRLVATIHPIDHRPDDRNDVTTPPVRGPSAKDVRHLSSSHRVRVAFKIAKVLYLVEFFLLIELVEVMIPVIYVLYLGTMSHLPNRAYYPRLASLDEDELAHSISNVMLNAGLEFISFLVACRLLDRLVKISSLHLLGFALESQRTLVQSSLVTWTIYMIQLSLAHTGVDFTMQFAWLRDKNDSFYPPTPTD